MGTAIGREGEEAAAAFLSAQGYHILGRNVRFRTGEIDIVAQDGSVLVFVEVKTRTSSRFGTPVDAITPQKQRKLVQLAALYLARLGSDDQPCRFDVVAVVPRKSGPRKTGPGGAKVWECTLIQDAFSGA